MISYLDKGFLMFKKLSVVKLKNLLTRTNTPEKTHESF